jgi:hypothetical protein
METETRTHQDVGCLGNMGGVLCIRFGRTGTTLDPEYLFVNTQASEHCSGPARAFNLVCFALFADTNLFVPDIMYYCFVSLNTYPIDKTSYLSFFVPVFLEKYRFF